MKYTVDQIEKEMNLEGLREIDRYEWKKLSDEYTGKTVNRKDWLKMEIVKENNKTVLNVFCEKLNNFKEKLKLPRGTDAVISINKIYVPRRISDSTPRVEKYKKYEKYFLRHEKVDKPIEVFIDKYNKNRYILNDGYIRFLILQNYDITDIPVRIVENSK